jgi:hypothetical protein
MVSAAQDPDLSEPVVRVATRKDASLLAELGARTIRESSPDTRHEDVESYVRENFTREKLITCLSVKNTTALILEKCGQGLPIRSKLNGFIFYGNGQGVDWEMCSWFEVLNTSCIRALRPFGLRYGKITKEPFASISVGDFERLVCTILSWAGMSKRISFSCGIFIQPNAPTDSPFARSARNDQARFDRAIDANLNRGPAMSEEQATFSPSRNTTAKINKEPTDSTLSLAENLELAIARLTIGPPVTELPGYAALDFAGLLIAPAD